jgi:hypothetical protein
MVLFNNFLVSDLQSKQSQIVLVLVLAFKSYSTIEYSDSLYNLIYMNTFIVYASNIINIVIP